MFRQKIQDNIKLYSQKKEESKRKGFWDNLLYSVSSGVEKASGAAIDLLGVATGLNYFDSFKELSEGSRYNAAQLSQQANRYSSSVEGYMQKGDLS